MFPQYYILQCSHCCFSWKTWELSWMASFIPLFLPCQNVLNGDNVILLCSLYSNSRPRVVLLISIFEYQNKTVNWIFYHISLTFPQVQPPEELISSSTLTEFNQSEWFNIYSALHFLMLILIVCVAWNKCVSVLLTSVFCNGLYVCVYVCIISITQCSTVNYGYFFIIYAVSPLTVEDFVINCNRNGTRFGYMSLLHLVVFYGINHGPELVLVFQ